MTTGGEKSKGQVQKHREDRAPTDEVKPLP